MNQQQPQKLQGQNIQVKTNHQHQQINSTPIKNSLLTHHQISTRYLHRFNIAYFAISIFIILFILYIINRNHQRQNIIPQVQKHTQNQLALFNSISYNLSQLGKQKCQNESKECVQLSQSFDQIVQMMKMMTQTFEQDKNQKNKKYFLGADAISHIKNQLSKRENFQQKTKWLNDEKKSKLVKLQLKGLQHIRLTSPKIQQPFKLSFQAFKYYTGISDSYKYQGLNSMLQNDGTIWKSEGNMMTVFSGQPISPLIFQIQFPQEEINESVKILIFGLKAQQTVLSVQNTLLHNILGKFEIKKGSNNGQQIFYCQNFECQQKYSLILLIMKPIHLKSFQIYQIMEQAQKDV